MAPLGRTRRLPRVAAALTVGALLAASCSAEPDQSTDPNDDDFGSEVTLTFGHPFPPTDPIQVNVWEPWIEEIRAASDGTINIEIHAGGALGPPPQVYENVVSGAQDLGWTLPGYTPGRFPITQIIEAPFAFPDAVEGTEVAWQLWEEFEEFQAEYNDVQLLALWAMDTGDLFTRDQRVERLEDLAGLTIRSPAPLQSAALEAMGAAAVGMPAPEIFDAIERGVIDGYKLANSATRVFDLGPTTGYRTVCNCYTGAFVLVLNPQAWERLSPAQQQVMEEHSGFDLAMRLAREHVAMADEVAATYWPDNGVESVELSAAEADRWREAVQPVYDQWIAEREADGVPGQQMFDRVFGAAG
jgi:TRAP-type C4-dicarboxylate transport system substrate-binding protein